jgi:hypothetical protein
MRKMMMMMMIAAEAQVWQLDQSIGLLAGKTCSGVLELLAYECLRSFTALVSIERGKPVHVVS